MTDKNLTRLAFFALLFALVLLFSGRIHGQTSHILTSGLLSASQVEDEQGYYAIGQGVVLMVYADGSDHRTIPHEILHNLRGKKFELILREIP